MLLSLLHRNPSQSLSQLRSQLLNLHRSLFLNQSLSLSLLLSLNLFSSSLFLNLSLSLSLFPSLFSNLRLSQSPNSNGLFLPNLLLLNQLRKSLR